MIKAGKKFLAYYQKWDLLVFTLFTMFSLLSGQTSVFYLIYFFWWNELLRIVIDRIFYRKNSNVDVLGSSSVSILSSLFIMAVYFVFIVVFFGFMAAVDNEEIIWVNMRTLFFRNWFFNANLIFVLIERIVLHKTQQPITVSFGGFTPNMIVLHISIILGGLIMFFVVRNFPDTFTPHNLWGSVLIALPFLLLKMAGAYLRT